MLELLVRLIHEGGWTTLPMVVLGAPGLVLAVVLGVAGFTSRERRLASNFARGLLVLGVVILALGALGWRSGLNMTEHAVTMVKPEMAPQIRAQGDAESRSCLVLALALAAWPLACATMLGGIALAQRGDDRSTTRLVGSVIAGAGVLTSGLLLDWSQWNRHEGEMALASVSPDFQAHIAALAEAAAHRHLVEAGVALVVGLGLAIVLFAMNPRVAKADLSAG